MQIGDSHFEPRERVRYTRDQLLELREVLNIWCFIQSQFLDLKIATDVFLDVSFVVLKNSAYNVACCICRLRKFSLNILAYLGCGKKSIHALRKWYLLLQVYATVKCLCSKMATLANKWLQQFLDCLQEFGFNDYSVSSTFRLFFFVKQTLWQLYFSVKFISWSQCCIQSGSTFLNWRKLRMEVEAFTVDEGEVAHVDVKQNGRKLHSWLDFSLVSSHFRLLHFISIYKLAQQQQQQQQQSLEVPNKLGYL